MNRYNEAYKNFFEEFGDHSKMVLSSSLNDIVTSRMMSIVVINHKFYFQTDKMSRKYEQLKKNKNVSLCIDNIQINGLCEEIGKPVDDNEFISVYKKHFHGSYRAYTLLDGERLFMVTPNLIERWLYIESIPYIEMIDIDNVRYSLEKYL